jgi:hypothetical protein
MTHGALSLRQRPIHPLAYAFGQSAEPGEQVQF